MGWCVPGAGAGSGADFPPGGFRWWSLFRARGVGFVLVWTVQSLWLRLVAWVGSGRRRPRELELGFALGLSLDGFRPWTWTWSLLTLALTAAGGTLPPAGLDWMRLQ